VKSRTLETALPAGRDGTLSLRFANRDRTRIRRALTSGPVYVLVYAQPRGGRQALAQRRILVQP
jgi:hypothetical protein